MRIYVQPGLTDRDVIEAVEQWEERLEQDTLHSWVWMHKQPQDRLTLAREAANER